jgi:Domain of unknown function (DUF4403)
MKDSAMRALWLVLSLLAVGCSRFGAVYPPRPSAVPSSPSADPPPSRVVVHFSVTGAALQAALDDAVPKQGAGTFPLLGAERHYTWTRPALAVRFSQGGLILGVHVDAKVEMPLRSLELPFDLEVHAEPVVNRDFAVKLQSVTVNVTSSDRRLELVNAVAGVFDILGKQVKAQVEQFAYDLHPLVGDAYARTQKPMTFPVGDAEGCARVKVLSLEAGPTVIADGLDKDIAMLVAPQVTLPCGESDPEAPLPMLENVASLPSGPFTVRVPIAASYDELTKAMTATFTQGKLYFAKDYPELYLEKPELYESLGVLVLKLHMAGAVHAMGIDADLDGDIFFSGHIRLADNDLSIPDLEPTIETKNFLLSLKAATGEATIRDQARSALRLDLSDRIHKVRAALADELTFGTKNACLHADIDKVDVASVNPHGSYLRVYVDVTGRVLATMPCASALPIGSPP